MIPEVATYIQSFKNFLNKNDEANSYFLNGIDENLFFRHFEDVARQNFEKFGEPMLKKEQLEFLRETMIKVEEEKKIFTNGIFIEIPNYGFICLN
jgi:hypothetical protein